MSKRPKTVFELSQNTAWEKTSIGFKVVGSKLMWESAVYSQRADKVVISRVVDSGGKPFYLGLGCIHRYVKCETPITEFVKREQSEDE